MAALHMFNLRASLLHLVHQSRPGHVHGVIIAQSNDRTCDQSLINSKWQTIEWPSILTFIRAKITFTNMHHNNVYKHIHHKLHHSLRYQPYQLHCLEKKCTFNCLVHIHAHAGVKETPQSSVVNLKAGHPLIQTCRLMGPKLSKA